MTSPLACIWLCAWFVACAAHWLLCAHCYKRLNSLIEQMDALRQDHGREHEREDLRLEDAFKKQRAAIDRLAKALIRRGVVDSDWHVWNKPTMATVPFYRADRWRPTLLELEARVDSIHEILDLLARFVGAEIHHEPQKDARVVVRKKSQSKKKGGGAKRR